MEKNRGKRGKKGNGRRREKGGETKIRKGGEVEVSAGSCSQTQASEVGRCPPHPPTLAESIAPCQRLHCQPHLSILPPPSLSSTSSSLSSLLQTPGHRPCRDTVIYTFYFIFPLSLYCHRSNTIDCHHHKKEKKKAKNICLLQLLPPPPP